MTTTDQTTATSACDFCQTTSACVTVTEDGNPWPMRVCDECLRVIADGTDGLLTGTLTTVDGHPHIAHSATDKAGTFVNGRLYF